MKTFAIFPSLTIFLIALTLFQLTGKVKGILALVYGAAIAAVFYGFTVLYSDAIFPFIFSGNVISLFIAEACVTYLGYKFALKTWGSPSLSKIVSIVVTTGLVIAMVFVVTIIIALANNPMDPPV